MADAMVTGRMASVKKERGNRVLERAGLTASEAINLLYDRLIEEQDAAFLQPRSATVSRADWMAAFAFVDDLTLSHQSSDDFASASEIREMRLRGKGLM